MKKKVKLNQLVTPIQMGKMTSFYKGCENAHNIPLNFNRWGAPSL